MAAPSPGSEIDPRWARAIALFTDKDLAGALFVYESLARDGHDHALVEIGNIYELGGGNVERDPSKAATHYRAAAFKLDDPDAHVALARLYFNGDVTSEDAREAFERHARRAGAAGRTLAYLMLGQAYHTGRLVPRDLAEAETCYRRAADAGYVLATRHLGQLYIARGRLIRGVLLIAKAMIDATRLGMKDPQSPMLAGIR